MLSIKQLSLDRSTAKVADHHASMFSHPAYKKRMIGVHPRRHGLPSEKKTLMRLLTLWEATGRFGPRAFRFVQGHLRI